MGDSGSKNENNYPGGTNCDEVQDHDARDGCRAAVDDGRVMSSLSPPVVGSGSKLLVSFRRSSDDTGVSDSTSTDDVDGAADGADSPDEVGVIKGGSQSLNNTAHAVGGDGRIDDKNDDDDVVASTSPSDSNHHPPIPSMEPLHWGGLMGTVLSSFGIPKGTRRSNYNRHLHPPDDIIGGGGEFAAAAKKQGGKDEGGTRMRKRDDDLDINSLLSSDVPAILTHGGLVGIGKPSPYWDRQHPPSPTPMTGDSLRREVDEDEDDVNEEDHEECRVTGKTMTGRKLLGAMEVSGGGRDYEEEGEKEQPCTPSTDSNTNTMTPHICDL
ncbi:hypothetical protein ACHAXA_003200 [Cyclostephanos tholiformis]|uniref:Uncharacterized protein n=1 Tax=Cyclostephanos tholiformis TaxID=382380 RepID=A0ABD3RYI0_9STRA